MRKVKIVFPGWIKAPNGTARFVYGLNTQNKEFEKRGVALSLLSLDARTGIRNFDNKKEIEKRSILKSRLMKLTKYSYLLTYMFIYMTSIKHSKFIVRQLDEQLRNERVDILHFQELISCYYYLKHCSKSGVKVYVTLHTDGSIWSMLEGYLPRFRSTIFSFMKRSMEKLVLEKADKINFVADNPRKHFCELYPTVASSKTSFVYNGIPDIQFCIKKSESNDVIRLVCVGTVNSRKNQRGIIEALSLMTPDLQQRYVVTFVGDGDEKSSLEKFALSLNADIKFVGSSDRVNFYLQQADAFILFSKDEGLPISIVEAMRCGLPIISTKIAGIPEMIEDGLSGFLVDVDVNQLKSLFTFMATERPDFEQMGKRSREIYEEKFSLEAMIDGYVRLWKE